MHLETIDLSALGLALPSEGVGVVLAQPYSPDSAFTASEPYQITTEGRAEQIEVLRKTLGIALKADHGAGITHFTVFPEYSIPGVDGVSVIQQELEADTWPRGTIVIGGVDALTQPQYAQVSAAPRTYVGAQHEPDLVPPDRWLNCAIVWIKGADGQVLRWLQPKLHPAWLELNVCHKHMFCGKSVFVFKGALNNGAPFRFCTLICLDWAAKVGEMKAWEEIVSGLHEEIPHQPQPLSWLFVIQRNERPSHDSFMSEVPEFFNQTRFVNALRERACIIFSNSSGLAAPGRATKYGASSVIFGPQTLFAAMAAPPTVSGGGPKFRESSTLVQNSQCRDYFFRERGPCVHSFFLVNPGIVQAGAAGRRAGVEKAAVFSLSSDRDPRTPGAAVPASVKWMNDELDSIEDISNGCAQPSLLSDARTSHQAVVAGLRLLPSPETSKIVRLAVEHNRGEPEQDADKWGEPERGGVEHVVHTLDLVNLAFPTAEFLVSSAHAVADVFGDRYQVLAIRGNSHQSCREASKNFVAGPRQRLLVVSRDRQNTRTGRASSSFLSARGLEERDSRITDAYVRQIGFQDCLEALSASDTVQELKEAIQSGFTI